jgi:menaquinone-dependent protoporphyrinogen oxidase
MTVPPQQHRDGRHGSAGGAHDTKVLVSAASGHGATTEIARAITEALTAHGFATTMIPPAQVSSIEDFDAVILGSAVYVGHWLDPARDLVTRFRDALAARPVWLFSSGPVGDPARKLVQAMGKDPVDIAEIRAATHARDHRMFAGKLDPKALSRTQRASLLVFRGLRGDFRDWAEIRRWADGIAEQLAAVGSDKPGSVTPPATRGSPG